MNTRALRGWESKGLRPGAADNEKVDAFIDRGRRVERTVSPEMQAAARISGAPWSASTSA
ncbi:hypothetical protein AB0903_20080 [Streptomyces sp. NPDC048389]|uniref:hypothetical protein n=1 Tax=Streptomyces sp. NPDC048389 TaxID=3154622 RepID=UPI003455E6F3